MTAAGRRRARLLCRDLAAAAAFASMAISGQVPPWAVGLFALALLLALLQRRIFSGRGLTAALGLTLIAAALYALVAAGALDLVLAACAFAGIIAAQRMLAVPSLATDSQVHLASILMIAGGAALSGELLFAPCLVAFAALAICSLGLSVVDAALPEGAELDLRPLGWRLGVASLAALAGAAAFFVAFPRLSWNLAARKVAPGLGAIPNAGFADRIHLGGDGTIKRNPRVVLRATIEPDPRVLSLQAYWVGRTYDTFTGQEWTGRGEVLPAKMQVQVGPGSEHTVRQRIELLPAYGARAAVALERPVLIANAVARWPGASSRTVLEQIEGEEVRFAARAQSYTYHAFSAPPGEPGDPDEDPARYLALPAGLDPRIPELARELAGRERDALRTAERLRDQLQSRYRYSLELSGAADPLADFLFERKAGHCEHFATALAVLLRSLGIPARVAAGFYGGERVGDAYVVRAADAHAWTQVLVPGRGFVTMDATPPEAREGQPAPLFGWLMRLYEGLDDTWRSTILDYSFVDQMQFARELVRPPARPSGVGLPRVQLRPLLGALAAGLATYALWRAPRRRRGQSARAREATRFLDQIEAILRRSGLEPAPGEGLEELSARLYRARHPISPALRRVCRRYVEARFGERPLADRDRARWLAILARAEARARRGRRGRMSRTGPTAERPSLPQ